MYWIDGAASVVIGLILAGTAWLLAVETKDLLIGEAASPATIAGIRKLAAQVPGVEKVNEVLTLHMGPEYILVNVSLDFADDCTAGPDRKRGRPADQGHQDRLAPGQEGLRRGRGKEGAPDRRIGRGCRQGAVSTPCTDASSPGSA